jgi:hypothetical protein
MIAKNRKSSKAENSEYKKSRSNINRYIRHKRKGNFRIVQVLKDKWDYIIPMVFIFCNIGSILVVYWMTSDQNSITRNSVEHAKEASIIENRPYVFPSFPIGVLNSHKQPMLAYLPIVNLGNTPAYKFFGVYKYQRLDSIENPKYYTCPPDPLARIIPPNSSDTIKKFVDSTTFNSSANARFYWTGKFWYTDYWNIPHYTEFVYVWRYDIRSFERIYEYDKADTNKQTQTNK